MNDLIELVDRVTSDLPWPPERLVVDATARGRTRLRRRRTASALSALTLTGCLGAGFVAWTSGGTSGVTTAVDSADQPSVAPPSGAPTPGVQPTPSGDGPWTLAVTAAQVPAGFAKVMGGQITPVVNKEMDDADPIVDFSWNGYAVRVGLTSDSYETGRPVRDPLTRCQQFGSTGPCVPGQVPGSYEQASKFTGPQVDGGATTAVVTVYYAQGWDVTVMESNAADFKDSPAIAADVPLTLDQLRAAAYNGVWFQ